jgi:hypothetical protein
MRYGRDTRGVRLREEHAMPDTESAIRAHQSGLYLDAARRHLAEAGRILAARPEAERSTTASEAALLMAQSQAESAMSQAESVRSIAETLTRGIQIYGKKPEGPLASFRDDPLTAIAKALDRLIDKLDDLG